MLWRFYCAGYLRLLGSDWNLLANSESDWRGIFSSIAGIVKDESGSAIGNASAEVMNPLSGFHRETTTDSDGAFRFTNVPFNPYHVVVSSPGFAKHTQEVDVRSTVTSLSPSHLLTVSLILPSANHWLRSSRSGHNVSSFADCFLEMSHRCDID